MTNYVRLNPVCPQCGCNTAQKIFGKEGVELRCLDCGQKSSGEREERPEIGLLKQIGAFGESPIQAKDLEMLPKEMLIRLIVEYDSRKSRGFIREMNIGKFLRHHFFSILDLKLKDYDYRVRGTAGPSKEVGDV